MICEVCRNDLFIKHLLVEFQVYTQQRDRRNRGFPGLPLKKIWSAARSKAFSRHIICGQNMTFSRIMVCSQIVAFKGMWPAVRSWLFQGICSAVRSWLFQCDFYKNFTQWTFCHFPDVVSFSFLKTPFKGFCQRFSFVEPILPLWFWLNFRTFFRYTSLTLQLLRAWGCNRLGTHLFFIT